MALSAHALGTVPVSLKLVSNERHFTLEAEAVLHSYLPSHFRRVTEIFSIERPVHALRAVRVRLKSVSKERQFTLDAETVFRPYVMSHRCG
jgi:hypothetical protein